jgi:hypothetical protein
MVRAAWLLALCPLFAAGCGGGTCEEDLPLDVSVADSNGLALSDAEVMLVPDGQTSETGIPCPSNGDGTYACTAPTPGPYQLYVTPVIPSAPPYYEAYGTTVEIEVPEDCDAPALTHQAIVRFEAGGA